jgi:hypothetical protein
MPKRIKQSSRPKDINQLAHYLVELSTQKGDSIAPPRKAQISVVMSHLGRKGGKIGGKRRLETMTAEQRTAIARLAANTRWNKNEN